MPKGIYDHSMLKKPESRFWDYVDKTGDCWLWKKGKTSLGYGHFSLHKRETYYAHRWSWEKLVGPIPKGKHLDHICHQASCVNPEHLRLATQSQNLANTRLRSDNTSGHKGVCRIKVKNGYSWVAQINWQGKHYFIKQSINKKVAIKAYNDKAKELFGEFAYIP